MQATMAAPRVTGPNTPVGGFQPAPAPQKQANPLEEAAQKAFAVIKKILDAEITAYGQRFAAKVDQRGHGYVTVGIENAATGQTVFMAVKAENILKYLSVERLKEIDQMDPVKRAKFESVVSLVVQKLANPLLTKEHPYIISSCEKLQGRIADSKLVRSIVVQVCKL